MIASSVPQAMQNSTQPNGAAHCGIICISLIVRPGAELRQGAEPLTIARQGLNRRSCSLGQGWALFGQLALAEQAEPEQATSEQRERPRQRYLSHREVAAVA